MFVFSNLATSLDGKIATQSREPFWLGTEADRNQMQVLRKRADAVLMGASTLRTHRRFCGLRKAPASRQPANIILSSGLEGVSPSWPFFQDPELRRILFVTKKIPAARLARFKACCEVVEIKGGKSSAKQVIAALAKRGIKKLLVEGGGGIMWDFASQNLIDEYNVTLTPKIVGGTESPTLVDGTGFLPESILSLKLVSCRKLKDELYLVYRKLPLS